MRWRFWQSERSGYPFSLQQLLEAFQYQGWTYAGTVPSLTEKAEQIGENWSGFVGHGLKGNAVVFSCMQRRASVFSEARFQWRQMSGGRPGDLFGNQELAVLETPWPNGTTGDLLSRMIQDVDLCGNSFTVRRAAPVGSMPSLLRLRPDLVDVVLDGAYAGDPEAAVRAYAYWPEGRTGSAPPEMFDVRQVAHFIDAPDPDARYRGMSWLTPVVTEVMADTQATRHKLRFFENGATPSTVVTLDVQQQEAFDRWVQRFREGNEGTENAYRTLFLGAGADVKVVGADLKQLDFKLTQGAGETRICAAAGVPPVVVGLSEGLQAATYSNYGQARRHFADGTLRPLWRKAASALETILNVPGGAHLWYDDRDIAFCREDVKDAAEAGQIDAATIVALVNGGFEPKSAIAAVTSGDKSRLVHTGLLSVQLQPPGVVAPTATNGKGNPDQVAQPA
jgi:HK97 family phage portal protein